MLSTEKGWSVKTILKYLLKIIILVMTTLISILILSINYVPKILWIAVVIYVVAAVYFIFIYRKKHRKLYFFISFLAVNMLGILFADGLFRGEKTDYSMIWIRGALSVVFDNRIVPDEKLFDSIFAAPDYNDKGLRITEWEPPVSYTFEQISKEGVSFEVIRPENPNNRVILMLHGGGYVGKLIDLYNNFTIYYSEANGGSTVVSLDYKTAQEYTYMDTISDVIYVYQWLLDSGYEPENIVITGDSAGGGLALASVLYMRDHDISLPGGIITISAWTNLAGTSESYQSKKGKDPYFSDNNILKMAAEMYVKEEDATNPYISPYYGDFTGFPPVLMQVGSYEMLYNDSKDIVERAVSNGASFTFEAYPGMFHEFQLFKGLSGQADIAWDNITSFLQKLYQ